MLVFLIVGLLIQNCYAFDKNQTEILEALKIVHSIMNKNLSEVITVKPPIPKRDILTYIHNLHPNLLHRPGEFNLHDDNHLPLLVDPRENIARTIFENQVDNEENRRFVSWFQNLFGIRTGRNTKKKKNATRTAGDIIIQSKTTKLTTTKTTTTTTSPSKKTSTTKTKKTKSTKKKSITTKTTKKPTTQKKKATTTKKKATTTKKQTTTTKKKTTTTKKKTTTTKKKPKLRVQDEIDIYDDNIDDDDSDTGEMLTNRRLMDWFKNLFGKFTTTTTTTTPTPTILINDDIKNELRESLFENNLTNILDKINLVLEKFNENLEKQNTKLNVTSGFLVLRVPFQPNNHDVNANTRHKREITNSSLHSIVGIKKKNDSNITMVQGTRRFINTIPVKNSNTNVYNNRLNENVERVYTLDKNAQDTNELKEKLIRLIAESFKDIKQKIEPLKTLKEKLSGDNSYVIGYVMASIDTLEVNLTKLIAEMELKKNVWNENKLMELFERMNMSNNVIRKLIDSMKKYTENR